MWHAQTEEKGGMVEAAGLVVPAVEPLGPVTMQELQAHYTMGATATVGQQQGAMLEDLVAPKLPEATDAVAAAPAVAEVLEAEAAGMAAVEGQLVKTPELLAQEAAAAATLTYTSPALEV